MSKRSSKYVTNVNEREIAILNLLAEYRYLTTRDLWLALEPGHKDSTAIAHTLAQMRAAGLIRTATLPLQRGNANPRVYSLLKTGADAIGQQLGSQYYRKPGPEQAGFQSLRLQLEQQLTLNGWSYIRPAHYGGATGNRPAVTPQSKLLIDVLNYQERLAIDRSLDYLASKLQRPADGPLAPANVYSVTPTRSSQEGSFLSEWEQEIEQSRRAREQRQEDEWRRWGIYTWLSNRGLPDPWDIPQDILLRMMRLNTCELVRQVPLTINDYVIYRRDRAERPRIVILPPLSSDIGFWLRKSGSGRQRTQPGRIELYETVARRFSCAALFSAGPEGQLSLLELDDRLRRASIMALRANDVALWLSKPGAPTALVARQARPISA